MGREQNSLNIARLEERLRSLDRLTEARFQQNADAIVKATAATDKRFEAVNEFRAQLSDQAARFITRESVDLLVESSRERVESVTSNNRKTIEEIAERTRLELGEVKAQATRLLFALLSTVVGTLIAALIVLWTEKR